MSVRSIAAPEGQTATFIELFFDLVFVFSVTQIVGLLHGGLTWLAIGQAALIFWLVWWAWTQFTWSLNVADTTHPIIALGTLVATAIAFFMVVAVPDVFHDRAVWFAVPYVLVRLIGIGNIAWVAWEDATQRPAVRAFGLISIAGLSAVLAGAVIGGAALYWLWGAAILFDVIAATFGTRSDAWALRAAHFAERHGLFVIIALGETLIVAGTGLAGAAWTADLLLVSMASVAIAGGFWWSYFPKAMPKLEHAFASRRGSDQAALARDAYSFTHYLMMLGVIGFAFAIEEAIAHPSDPLAIEGRLAMAVGLLLFVGGMGLAIWRATGRALVARLLMTALAAGVIVALADVVPAITLLVALLGVGLVAVVEQFSENADDS